MNRKLFDSLNEKQQRLYLEELAAEYSKGGITKVATEYGASRARVSRGMREYKVVLKRHYTESYACAKEAGKVASGRSLIFMRRCKLS